MKKKSSIPVLSYIRIRTEAKQAAKKYSSVDQYKAMTRHFRCFLSGKPCRLKNLTRTLVEDFSAYLHGLGLRPNTVNCYLGCLRAVYHAALAESLVCAKTDPFKGVKLRPAKTAKRAIPVYAIQKMAALPVSGNQRSELAVDLSLFSFMACGIPFVDLAYLTRENIRGNVLSYYRRKTGTLIRVEMTKGMRQLIRKYNKTGKTAKFLFPILPSDAPTREQYKRCLATHNDLLREIGKRIGLTDKLTSYVMRHSWASAALRQDVPIAVISQALGHTSEKTTRSYLCELDLSELSRANRKVSGSIDRLIIRKYEVGENLFAR